MRKSTTPPHQFRFHCFKSTLARYHKLHVERHLSVQASATNLQAIHFCHHHFQLSRVVLPRVLSMHQVKQIARETLVPLEMFAFGSLCIMAEGRCYLHPRG